MITHLVLFHLKSGFTASSAQVQQVHAAMAELPKRVPGIRAWQHGFNVTPDSQASDYGLYATFDDEQALFAYFEHPAHLEVVALWNKVSEVNFVDLKS